MKRERGITLIALVVTIIVLLILAGVSIAMITGQSGILKQAQETRTENAHAEVYEALNIKAGEHLIGKYTGEYSQSVIDYFLDKEYIYTMDGIEGYIVRVEKLLGGKREYGNGEDGKTDVYKLEETTKEETIGKVASVGKIKIAKTETEKIYKLVYYGKNKVEAKNIGIIKDSIEKNENEITFYIVSEIIPELSGTYHAEKDMTWNDFINSKYNTLKLKLDTFPFSDGGHAIKVDNGGRLFEYDDNYSDYINSTQKIIDEKKYCLRGWVE